MWGGGGERAYLLTTQHFLLKNDTFAFKLGNNVVCYQVLPNVAGIGKRLPPLPSDNITKKSSKYYFKLVCVYTDIKARK